jgi:hypothetical protein
MVELLTLRDLTWGLTTLLELILLFYLIRKKLYRTHLSFFIYLPALILQSAVVAVVYRYFGPRSVASFNIGWSTQAVVICLGWLAVIDIARKALSASAGIWDVATRVRFAVTACVLVYSVWSSNDRWTLAVLTADRTEELCIATSIVFLLLFLPYYRVDANNLERMLAIGFCLYSCFSVINVSVYQHLRLSYGSMRNYLDILAFVASLLLWVGAVRSYSDSPSITIQPALTLEHYAGLSAKLNSRLHLLNHRLDNLFRSGDSRP